MTEAHELRRMTDGLHLLHEICGSARKRARTVSPSEVGHRGASFYRDLEFAYSSGAVTGLVALSSFLRASRDIDRIYMVLENLVSHLAADVPLSLRKRSEDVSAIVREAIDCMEPAALDKGVEVRTDIPDEAMLRVDRELLFRVFVNCLDNAIKYSFKTGQNTEKRFITVRMWRYSSDNKYRFEFESYGVGVLKEEIATGFIYEYGSRGKLARDEHRKGLGIGLAECRKIAKAHTGRFWLDSNCLQGDAYLTVATLELPEA